MNFPQSHLINKSRLFLTVSALLYGVLNPVVAKTNEVDSGLDTVIKGVWRSDENRARDQYRHPKQTLEFFGVQANATVIEITPGGSAWYGEILAPFLKETGHYIAANIDGTKVSASSAAYQTRTADVQDKKFLADPERYSKASTINFDPAAPQFGPANSADYVLTFRNVHNWVGDHTEVPTFKAMFDVLKPGGVLGVVDHRAAAGKTLDAKLIDTGYLPEEYVIALAQQAGFKLVGKSEVNANPKDTKDYVKGVWTLPPTYADKENNRQKYKEIGESDRFTLRFVKP